MRRGVEKRKFLGVVDILRLIDPLSVVVRRRNFLVGLIPGCFQSEKMTFIWLDSPESHTLKSVLEGHIGA